MACWLICTIRVFVFLGSTHELSVRLVDLTDIIFTLHVAVDDVSGSHAALPDDIR